MKGRGRSAEGRGRFEQARARAPSLSTRQSWSRPPGAPRSRAGRPASRSSSLPWTPRAPWLPPACRAPRREAGRYEKAGEGGRRRETAGEGGRRRETAGDGGVERTCASSSSTRPSSRAFSRSPRCTSFDCSSPSRRILEISSCWRITSASLVRSAACPPVMPESPSEAVRSNPRHPEALRSTRKHSEALGSTRKHSEAIGSNRKQSEAIGSNWKHLETISPAHASCPSRRRRATPSTPRRWPSRLRAATGAGGDPKRGSEREERVSKGHTRAAAGRATEGFGSGSDPPPA